MATHHYYCGAAYTGLHPLTCGSDATSKILKHVGLLGVKSRPTSRAPSPPKELQIDFADSQVVYSGDYCDPDYSFDESKLLQKKKNMRALVKKTNALVKTHGREVE